MARNTTKKPGGTAKASSSSAKPTTARKAKPASSPAAKRAPRIPAPPKTPAVSTAPVSAGPRSLEMKKQELLQKVVTKSQIKKKDAKPVVEAMLEVLGEALADGRELNLQPFGKLKLNRTKETSNARIIVAKIRQSKSTQKDAGPGTDPLAAAAE